MSLYILQCTELNYCIILYEYLFEIRKKAFIAKIADISLEGNIRSNRKPLRLGMDFGCQKINLSHRKPKLLLLVAKYKDLCESLKTINNKWQVTSINLIIYLIKFYWILFFVYLENLQPHVSHLLELHGCLETTRKQHFMR